MNFAEIQFFVNHSIDLKKKMLSLILFTFINFILSFSCSCKYMNIPFFDKQYICTLNAPEWDMYSIGRRRVMLFMMKLKKNMLLRQK